MPGSHKWDETVLLTEERTLRTTVHHARGCLPFLEQFMDRFHVDDHSVIGARDVFPDYVAFVGEMTDDVQTLTAARSETVFERRFRPEAFHRRWPAGCSAGRRGFCVSLGRRHRVLPPAVDTLAAVHRYLQTPGNAWEGFWYRMLLDGVFLCF